MGRHYLGDVAAGLLLGICTTAIVTKVLALPIFKTPRLALSGNLWQGEGHLHFIYSAYAEKDFWLTREQGCVLQNASPMPCRDQCALPTPRSPTLVQGLEDFFPSRPFL